MEPFHEYLKRKREASGWSLAELERRSGVVKSYLSVMESIPCDPGLTVLKKLAAAYGMEVGDMLVEAGLTAQGSKQSVRLNLLNRIDRQPRPTDRIRMALGASLFGTTDGAHHKMWVIDQMVRALTGDVYVDWVRAFEDGEDGPHTYEWDQGIAP